VPKAANSSKARRGARSAGGGDARASRDAEGSSSAGHHRAAHQDRLGQALSDLLENPLVTGAIGRAWGAREKAAQAQELWMGALNLPSAADIERLTRRLRSVSQRLEGVEDSVQRIGRTIVQSSGIDERLQSIDERLLGISHELQELRDLVLARAGAEGRGDDAGPASSERSVEAGASMRRAGSRSSRPTR
jgi:hypothetical protein